MCVTHINKEEESPCVQSNNNSIHSSRMKRAGSISRGRSSSIGRNSLIPRPASSDSRTRKPSLVRSKSTMTPLVSNELTTPRLTGSRASQRRMNPASSSTRQSRPVSRLQYGTPNIPDGSLLSTENYESVRARVMLSPGRMKQLYSNLDEKKCMQRIINFVETLGLDFTVTKPTSINAFVGITQALLVLLCSPCQTPLTTKNYLTELPKAMIDLEYPMVISKTFLKSPNTPKNFLQVLTIWIFLLDWVEVINEPVEFSKISESVLKFYVNNGSEEARKEFFKDFLKSKGHDTKEELITKTDKLLLDLEILRKQFEKKEQAAKNVEMDIQQKREQRGALKEKTKKCMEENKVWEEKIRTSTGQVEYATDELRKLEERNAAMEESLAAIRAKNSSFSFTLEEVEIGNREIEILDSRLRNLWSRNEMIADQHRERQDRHTEIQIKAQSLIIEFNTTLMMSKLPESEKQALQLDVANITLDHVSATAQKLEIMLKQAEEVNQERFAAMSNNTNLLLKCEREYAEKIVAAEERQKERIEIQRRIRDLTVELNASDFECEQYFQKINRVREVLPKALKKREVMKEAVEKYKEGAKANMIKTKNCTEAIKNLIKEKNAEIINIREAANAARVAKVHTVKDKLEELIPQLMSRISKSNSDYV